MTELLHAADIPIGLVTNGEQWMLVFAPRGETSGFTSWVASLWIDEPITLRAFLSLLSIRRLIGVAASDTLLALLKESAQDQQEVTSQLGEQVRDAVEVLIQAFDRLDQDSGRVMLKGMDEKTLYDAALTVMMRLVFLFSAEERGCCIWASPATTIITLSPPCESSCRKWLINMVKKCWSVAVMDGRGCWRHSGPCMAG
jgi:hypothetical protein